jgi:hypothetical protein
MIKLSLMNEKLLYYIIILLVSGVPLVGLSYATSENLETYSNPQIGVEFKFPLVWELDSDTTTDKNCDPFCQVSFDIPSDGLVPVSLHSYNLNHPSIRTECMCNTLEEFVKWAYNFEPITSTIKFSGEVIYDNPVSINNNISGWEMESKFQGKSLRQSYYFWTLQNDIGYFISYVADEGLQYQKYLPEVKDMIKSLKFIPIEIPPKKNIPSFLQ